MQKILIANRGEIALRIIRTCQEMGIKTVAVYSDADVGMPFVKEADKAFRIGEPPVNKSYLRATDIIEIAIAEKVDGIHPGYGFLSENPGFARKAAEAGIIFIGPDPETIEAMGDKIVSRNTMKRAGVPVVPGSETGHSTLKEAGSLAESIGFPVMLKASGGGGGIAMVLCQNEEALSKAFAATKTRAKAYFGSDEVFVEKYIENARHVEVQIFGDSYGNLIHLFERDCSIQRRHQKVIEESPSPFVSEDTREKMYKTALEAAAAVQYVNAGTVEFIVDEHGNFYFLEMNTRLQVEHPVTEQITGIDLVQWQILVARGEKLPLLQADITRSGHSIEFRLYAEDPVTFLPSPGRIDSFKWETASGVRIDSGFEAGSALTPFYDPLIAKCIFHGQTRKDAVAIAHTFFNSLTISGIKTNAPLFTEILADEDFQRGHYSTGYLAAKKFTGK